MTHHRNYTVVKQANGALTGTKSQLQLHGQARITTSLLPWLLAFFASLATAFLLGRHSMSSYPPIRRELYISDFLTYQELLTIVSRHHPYDLPL